MDGCRKEMDFQPLANYRHHRHRTVVSSQRKLV